MTALVALANDMEGGFETAARLLASVDAYPKTMRDFQEKTRAGAVISVLSLLLALLLSAKVLQDYARPAAAEHLHVDTSVGKRITINLNITFPRLPCAGLGIVAMDVAGEQQIDIDRDIVKTRLSHAGAVLGVAEQPKPVVGCGSCFPKDASLQSKNAGRCCNTCADVRDVYGRLLLDGRRPEWEEHPLCEHEAALLEPALLAKYREGCALEGRLVVNKVAGNFHIAPGRAKQNERGQLIHEFTPFDYATFNTSHYITSLSFGQHYPNRHNPLDNVGAVVPHASGVFRYFAKVVPTTYRYANGKTLETHQYSVAEEFRSTTDTDAGFVLPGLFVIYDISPIEVTYEESRPSLGSLLVTLCAIAGGIFTVGRLVDTAVHSASKSGQPRPRLAL